MAADSMFSQLVLGHDRAFPVCPGSDNLITYPRMRGDRCAAGGGEQCGVFTPQIQRWLCSEAILIRQLCRQSRWRNKNRQRMRFEVTLACKCALPSCWHMLCLKNGAEETCLPLNQGWRCKDLMPFVGFFFFPWKWEHARSYALLFRGPGEEGKSCIWKHSWAEASGSHKHSRPTAGSSFGSFLPSATSLLHPPRCGDEWWPSHEQPFAISLNARLCCLPTISCQSIFEKVAMETKVKMEKNQEASLSLYMVFRCLQLLFTFLWVFFSFSAELYCQ